MKKKGDAFLENLVSLVVFIVGAVFLLIGIWSVYQSAAFQEKRNAEKAFSIIEAKLKSLSNVESTSAVFQGPCRKEECNWFLTAWSENDQSNVEKCFLKESCLCICKGDYKKRTEACNLNGLCAAVNFSEVKIEGGLVRTEQNTYSADYTGAGADVNVEVITYPVIKLRTNLNEIFFSKQGDKLTIRAE